MECTRVRMRVRAKPKALKVGYRDGSGKREKWCICGAHYRAFGGATPLFSGAGCGEAVER